MKKPAHLIFCALFAGALLCGDSVFSQEAPSPDKSSKVAGGAPAKPKGAIKKSPQVKPAKPTKAVKKEAAFPSPGILIAVEYIEVNHDDFSDWLFENKLTTDGTELRKTVQKWVKDDDAEIIKTTVVHARSGQRAQTESIEEYIYPTEFDPAETASEPNLSDDTEAPVIPPNPCAFETRNLGTTLEVDPVLSEDGNFIDLNLSPEIVYLLDQTEWVTETNGEEQVITQPLIYSVKTTTQVVVRNGGYAFLSTLELPDEDDEDDEDRIVLLFVRADAN